MRTCHMCQENSVRELIHFGSHPIAHRLLSNPDDGECVYPVILGFCRFCGLTQLIDPIPPGILYTNYHILSSWKWNPHVPRVIDLIQAMGGLSKDARILEVGCNDGSFLQALKEAGFVNLHGVEPAQDAYAAAVRRGLKLDLGYFDEDYGRSFAQKGACDLIIVRQVLEHVSDLKGFGKALRTVLQPGARVLIEVPDFDFNVRWPDYSAVWEEHVNYFTRETLARFFADNDLLVEHMETAVFSGQILIAYGVCQPPGKASLEYVAPLEAKAEAYKKTWPAFKEAFLKYLNKFKGIAVYGAGCRACSLVNFTGAKNRVTVFFDDQKEKQGKIMPGSRKQILSGNELGKHGIDLCLLSVNVENEKTVLDKHKGFSGSFRSVNPPSKHLPDFWRTLLSS